MTIRVLLVDDDALLRMGLVTLLSSADDVEVVGEASGGRQGLALARQLRPHVVVMDVRMPDLDGITATRAIVAEGLPSRVLVLTTFAHDEYVQDALHAGASGFLLKRVAPDRLLDAVRVVADGEALLDPAVTRSVIADAVRRGDRRRHDPRLDDLTQREAQVLRLMAAGLSNTEIAEHLVVEVSTVKTHVHHVLAKTGARDRVGAVVLAYATGFVTPGDGPAPA